MNAKVVNLQILFQQPISYQIPQFQRPYAWRRDGQWEPLWEDVRNVAERHLKKGMGDIIRPHFMGAIILFPQTNKTGEVTKSIVVDGQQRLTTLQLLIKATQQLFQNQDDVTRADRLRELTTNPESYCIVSNDATKIRQSNYNDQTTFHAAIVDDYSDNSHQSIAEAYTYFKAEVNKWLNGDPNNRTARANALEDTLTKYLQIAAIDLDQDEEPHIIFETLNARSEPLKQSDLIKNTIMYEAGVIDDDQKARELWGMFEDQWWEEDTGETSKRGHIDRFLNYWMVMWKREYVTVEKVASEFRNYIQEKQPDIKIVATDIKCTGKIYKDLEEEKIPEIEIFLKRIKIMKLGAVTPLLLRLYTSRGLPREQRLKIVEVLESYLIRRMLCNLPSNNMNIFFISLLKELHNDKFTPVDKSIIKFLKDQTADSRVWPSDLMLDECLIERRMKETSSRKKSRKKMVLEAIEMSLRSEKSEPLGAMDRLTVEHIMPQEWERHWELPADVSDKSEAEAVRNETIETIGNLTLTTDKLNASLSNGPWNEKRETLNKHSTLFLNKTLLEDAPNVWDEAAIKKRSRDLAKIIMQIWPSADEFTGT